MVVVARLPTVSVDVNGQPLEPRQAAGLVEIVVRQTLSSPALCELVFADPPGTLDLGDVLSPGADLRVTLVGSEVTLFEGDVTGVEYAFGAAHARELLVRGYDRLHRLRKQQTVRVLLGMSALDLAREVGSSIGLGAVADEPGPVWERIVQHRHSDLRLLLDVASSAGLYATVRDGEIHLVTLEGAGEPVSLSWGTSLLEARVDVNGEPATRSVAASGWDATRVDTWTATASQPRVGRNIPASVSPEDVGGPGERVLVDEAVPTADRAAALAQAELDARVAREVTISGVAVGDPRLRPATPVDIDNLGPDVSGRYVLTEAVHRISRAAGYVTEISTVPPDRPERRYETVAVPGTVESVDDPDGLARVRVTLPTFADIESPWMEVLSVGAGSGKGLVALPDVGDRVLVLLLHGDPAQGVVLGGMYGAGGPPDSGVVSGAVKRYTLVTSGGQRIKLDDENGQLVVEDSTNGRLTMGQKTVRIEDDTGTSLEMSPQNVVLHSAVNLRIEAPGNGIVIKASSIDFQSG